MLVFCFVDLLATDFLLAAIVTYVVSKGLSVFRFSHLSFRQVGSVSQNLFTVKNSVLLQRLIPGKLIWFSGLSLAAPTWRQRLWLTGDSWYKVESSYSLDILCKLWKCYGIDMFQIYYICLTRFFPTVWKGTMGKCEDWYAWRFGTTNFTTCCDHRHWHICKACGSCWHLTFPVSNCKS